MVSVRHPQVFLNVKKAKNFKGYHPWVLDRSVVEPSAAIEAGQIVELVHADGRWIGRGVYNPHSRIRLRLYQWDQAQQLDADWCIAQLARAVQLRERWTQAHGQALDAVRLVNSEGDGLSGLVVDRFGDYIVVQITALAMLEWLEPIANWLMENLQPAGILLRMDPRTASSEGMSVRDEVLRGDPPTQPVEIQEHGVSFQLDLQTGQKTGYYLDQRANRLHAARWIPSGSMLDVCCYEGGFSLTAARWAKPEKITAVDSSARALEHAAANARRNGFENIDFVQADCFDYLEKLASEKQKFQSVVLDPPRMASSRNQVPAALRAYHRLNLSAVNLLEPEGILVTCSCSGRVSRDDFAGVLASVARRTGRSLQIIESHRADFDHPVDASCLETEYLKCFICRVS